MANESVPSLPLTYGRYLQLDRLLSLQQPQSEGPEHDEWLFITIHQVYELWFKQCLRELEALRAALSSGQTLRSLGVLKRVLTIYKTLVAQVDVLETMTPLQFNSFRTRLDSSSGFQSAQFRELEFLLGHKRAAMLDHYPAGSDERERLEARLAEPSIYDAWLNYLRQHGHKVPEELLLRDLHQPAQPSEALQQSLVALHREGGWEAQLCERLLDLDEGMQEWRYRHVKMVERTIGTKAGTGGSSGVDYLRSTLFKPLFADLWAIRAQL